MCQKMTPNAIVEDSNNNFNMHQTIINSIQLITSKKLKKKEGGKN